MEQAHNILQISAGIHKKAGPRLLNGHKGKDSANALDPSESCQEMDMDVVTAAGQLFTFLEVCGQRVCRKE